MRWRSDFEAFAHRSQTDCKGTPQRLRIDSASIKVRCAALAQRLRCLRIDSEAIENRLHTDCASIPHHCDALAQRFRGDCASIANRLQSDATAIAH
jgi:hypothetical protein